MSLAIKVTHTPSEAYEWSAQMYEDGKYVTGTVALSTTREDAIERCKRVYEAGLSKSEEWVPVDPPPLRSVS